MVNIVGGSNFLLQMHIIVNGGDNILLCNMLGNQIMDVLADGLL